MNLFIKKTYNFYLLSLLIISVSTLFFFQNCSSNSGSSSAPTPMSQTVDNNTGSDNQVSPPTTEINNSENAVSSGLSSIALGGQHTCMIVSGTLKCLGFNSSGQVGNGTTDSYVSKVTIISEGVTGVSLGSEFSCAIVSGALKCWGQNFSKES